MAAGAPCFEPQVDKALFGDADEGHRPFSAFERAGSHAAAFVEHQRRTDAAFFKQRGDMVGAIAAAHFFVVAEGKPDIMFGREPLSNKVSAAWSRAIT